MKHALLLTFLNALANAPTSAQEVRDSAGVEIVENSEVGVWTGETPWVVRAPPDLAIGRVAGAPPEMFANIESVVLLADGRIAVADRGSAQVRVFGAQGEHVGSFGREGEGPGEFKWLAWIGECRAGILEAFDGVLGRVTEIDLASLQMIGTRLINSPSLDRAPSTLECLPKGKAWLGSAASSGYHPRRPRSYAGISCWRCSS